MLCQEESQIFQILFIPGIFCHLLGLELLSYPFLSSRPNDGYTFPFLPLVGIGFLLKLFDPTVQESCLTDR